MFDAVSVTQCMLLLSKNTISRISIIMSSVKEINNVHHYIAIQVIILYVMLYVIFCCTDK